VRSQLPSAASWPRHGGEHFRPGVCEESGLVLARIERRRKNRRRERRVKILEILPSPGRRSSRAVWRSSGRNCRVARIRARAHSECSSAERGAPRQEGHRCTQQRRTRVRVQCNSARFRVPLRNRKLESMQCVGEQLDFESAESSNADQH
jgi:hypothetical protein